MTGEHNDTVHDLIQGLVDSSQEVGWRVAAYVDGALVVDAWAGVAGGATRRPVDAQ